MVRLLWRQPQHRDLVRDLGRPVGDRRRRKLADVYEAYLKGKLADLAPSAEGDHELQPTINEWLVTLQVSESHKHRLRQCFKALQHDARRRPLLAEVPVLIEEYRTHCIRAGTPRAFNYAKQGCLALFRDRVGRRHDLWLTVADIPSMPERKEGVLGMTVEEARAVRSQLSDKAAAIWWAMCCTGMGPTEFWGEWTVLSDRVRIKGTKRPGRRWGTIGREVPRVTTLVRPDITVGGFRKMLWHAGATPYQGRKSFAMWMEDAEIPRTRRRLYLGHSAQDVTDRYEKREITAFLAEDRERLLKVLGTDLAVVASS
jgi:hypothetical protein